MDTSLKDDLIATSELEEARGVVRPYLPSRSLSG